MYGDPLQVVTMYVAAIDRMRESEGVGGDGENGEDSSQPYPLYNPSKRTMMYVFATSVLVEDAARL